MRFDGFCGNERIRARLSQAASRGELPQFILLSGPAGSGKKTLARILAAAMECESAGEKPCGVCRACRKVFSGNHPDVITVTDEKKYYSVDTIRDLCAEVYIRPNEGRRKVYLLAHPFDPTRAEAQNALLKITEEPPPYAAFLILTENAERMLATVRSRAAILTLSPLESAALTRALRSRFPDRAAEDISAAAAASGGYLGQAIALLEENAEPDGRTAQLAAAFAAADDLALLQVTASMERLRRDQLQPLLQGWVALLTQALAAKSGASALDPDARAIARARTGADILRAVETIKQALEYASLNVSAAHIAGALSVLLRRDAGSTR